MARLHYMSLPNAADWDLTIKQIGAQLRPYSDYLWTAKNAAEARKPVLAWRPATRDEEREFQNRLDERWQQMASKARRASKRRDRHVRQQARGVWVVLEPPPWEPETTDDTFDAFLDTKTVHERRDCRKDTALARLDFDREGRALLLERLPTPVRPDESSDEPMPPSAADPHGNLVWLRPNTYTLERQVFALRNLENAPSPRLAPLVRLASTRVRWPHVAPAHLDEDEWAFLTRATDGTLRDGTDQQRRFVSVGLGTEDFAVLEGPPGSGKTTAICELIVQLLRRQKRVLLVASTHVAVDNVLERLLEWQDALTDEEKLVLPVRVGEEDRVTSDALVPFTLHRIRQTWRDELQDFFDAPGDVSPDGNAARQLLRDAVTRGGSDDDSPLTRLILEASNLVCGTTIGILKHPSIRAARQNQQGFEPFDVMILDEASKTTFTEFLVPALHARRWMVVGDIKQLSPYVEETDLRENLSALVPSAHARAAVHAFAASPDRQRPVRSVLAAAGADAEIARREAAARGTHYVLLDDIDEQVLRGVPRAVPELLYADLIIGSARALQRFEHRLPMDVTTESGEVPPLPDWHASRRAFGASDANKERRGDAEEELNWAAEVAWRLVRSYELRQSAVEKQRYTAEVRDLVPVSLDGQWFDWRRLKPRKDRRTGSQEAAHDALTRELGTVRRVAMPSILELLQTGFERLDGWDEGVVLTDGLPEAALAQRLVSLTFQHRMHPHISAFPREAFYLSSPDTSVDTAPALGLLHDAAGMADRRSWSYDRYAKRALWLDVPPRRERSGTKNGNAAEADTVLKELRAFVAWASANPQRDARGGTRPWEVAVLTFYRGQEALLRDALKRETGQFGNSRSFRLPRGAAKPAVTITLCTVDRFQGHEADLVLLSFVKSGKVGFLNSPNRLNVALTRARYQLVLVGHRAYFASERCRSPLLRSLAETQHYQGDIAWEVEA